MSDSQSIQDQSSGIANCCKALEGFKNPKDVFHGLPEDRDIIPSNVTMYVRSSEGLRSKATTANYTDRFDMITALDGEFSIAIQDNAFSLKPGESVLAFPREFHHFYDVEEVDTFKCCLMQFDLACSDGLEPLLGSPRVLENELFGEFCELTKTYRLALKNNARSHVGEVSYRLAQHLRSLLLCDKVPSRKASAEESKRDSIELIKQISNFVRESNKIVNIKEVADLLDMSESNLRLVFRESFGVSMGSFLLESRIAKAAEMIESKEYAIAEIAEHIGYETVSAFSAAFKNSRGVSPRQYGKNMLLLAQQGNK